MSNVTHFDMCEAKLPGLSISLTGMCHTPCKTNIIFEEYLCPCHINDIYIKKNICFNSFAILILYITITGIIK